MDHIKIIRENPDIQFIWQTGKYYFKDVESKVSKDKPDNLYITTFIRDMNTAYAAADLVVSRAGAGSISEFCLLHKAIILIPSPNVAEDHQTKNAMVLVNKDAAVFVKDADAYETLLPTAIETVKDDKKLNTLRINIAKLALPDSARIIAEEVIKLAKNEY